jgi:hypothetical protein
MSLGRMRSARLGLVLVVMVAVGSLVGCQFEAPPRIVLALAEDGQVTLTWLPPPGDIAAEVTGYVLTRSVGGVVQNTTNYPGSGGRTVVITGLTNGTTYTFVLRPVVPGIPDPTAASAVLTPKEFNFNLWQWGMIGCGGPPGPPLATKVTSPAYGGLSDVEMIATDSGDTVVAMAITTAGDLYAWGDNTGGQLTLANTGAYRKDPVRIATFTTWETVSVGNGHVLALTTDDKLYGWGNNGSGQLAQTIDDEPPEFHNTHPSPTLVGSPTDTWLAVAAGSYTSTAIKSDGTLWRWGGWGWGAHPEMSQVGSATDWVAISSGFDHTLGIRDSNGAAAGGRTLWSWGDAQNQTSDLGRGELPVVEGGYPGPAQVGSATDWDLVSAGGSTSFGIRDTNGAAAGGRNLYAWGDNGFGQLGLGGIGDERYTPQLVGDETVDDDWLSVDGGGGHSAAIKGDGTLWVWGVGNCGELGTGDHEPPYFESTPVEIASGADWTAAAAYNTFTFGVSE